MKFLYTILLLLTCTSAYCGVADTIHLSLHDVVEMAKGNSIASKQAITTRETKYWQWRTFKSNYQPQLSLSGNLPGYSKTNIQVIQPDGTVLFQPVHNDNSLV